ncbi:MAG: lamin tail domain-containing protein, partial [Alistipes sp.]|nr:lamin tail domain-containing protein [Alistipes sp.]
SEVYGLATISTVSNTVAYTENDEVTVSATIESLTPVVSAVLNYSAAGAAGSVDMTAAGSLYTGIIPAYPIDTEVTYSIEAATESGVVVSPVMSYTVGAVPVDYSGLVLNELNGNDKFIELYNKGAVAIPLDGVYVEKDAKNVWSASGVTLEPGAFLLLYSTDVAADHGDHPADLFFSSGLSAKKAVRVQLFSPSGLSLDDFNLVDCVKPAEASYSRCPDGTGAWMFAAATPGAPNADSSEKVEGLEGASEGAAGVVLNEIDGNAKFIELYNNGGSAVSLADYKMFKDGDMENPIWVGPAGMTVAGRGYLVLEGVKGSMDFTVNFNSGISPKKNVIIVLADAAGNTVDTFVRGTEGTGWGNTSLSSNAECSFSRCPDGTGEWAYAVPTRGAANGAKVGDIEQE